MSALESGCASTIGRGKSTTVHVREVHILLKHPECSANAHAFSIRVIVVSHFPLKYSSCRTWVSESDCASTIIYMPIKTVHVRKLHLPIETSRNFCRCSCISNSLHHCFSFSAEILSKLAFLSILKYAVIIGPVENDALVLTVEMSSLLWFVWTFTALVPSRPEPWYAHSRHWNRPNRSSNCYLQKWSYLSIQRKNPRCGPLRHSLLLISISVAKELIPSAMNLFFASLTNEILTVARLYMYCQKANTISDEFIFVESCQWDNHCYTSSFLWLMCKYHRSQT